MKPALLLIAGGQVTVVKHVTTFDFNHATPRTKGRAVLSARRSARQESCSRPYWWSSLERVIAPLTSQPTSTPPLATATRSDSSRAAAEFVLWTTDANFVIDGSESAPRRHKTECANW